MDQSLQKGAPIKARTIVLDTARLYKQNKITKEELARMDKIFRQEVIACADTLPPEEEPMTELKKVAPKVAPDLMKGYVPTRPKEHVAQTPSPTPTSTPVQPAQAQKATPPPPPPPPLAPKPPVPPVPPKPKPQPEPPKLKVEVKPVPPPPQTPPPPPTPPKPEIKLDPKPELNPEPKPEEQILSARKEELKKKKDAIAETLKESQSARNVLIAELESLRSKEKVVENEEKAIKKEEKSASILEMKAWEEKRWILEDRRQELEKERFETHKKIDEADAQISLRYKEQVAIDDEEKALDKELALIKIRKEAKEAKEEKAKEEKVYDALQIKKKKYEMDWIKMKEDIKGAKEQIAKIDIEALDLKKQIEALEKTETSAVNEKDRHDIEEKRWELEKKFREIETSVWKIDADIEQKMKDVESIEKVFADIQIEEETSKDKIKKYNTAIHKADIS
jgi:hypothetical protein